MREKLLKKSIKKFMDNYKILEHITDLKIQAFGKTREELFLNMLKGMSDSQKAELKDEKIQKEIKIESMDLDALLVDFLSEVLYLTQVNKEVYNDVRFTKFGSSTSSEQTILEAELFGNKVESFGEDIKAATYHGLKIEKKNGLFEATVLFDI